MNETGNASVIQTNGQIFFRFLRFGMLAWGGPIAQIAMIKQELVDEEKWITKEQFNRALSVYQVLPGPEAHELCVYFGMIAGGRMGGFLAGLAFMLPGFVLMMLLTIFYVTFGIKSTTFQYIFTGFQVAVVALIFSAVHRIGKHVIINKQLFAIAALSFLAYYAGVNIFIVLPVAGIAYVLYRNGKYNWSILSGLALLIISIYQYLSEDPTLPLDIQTIKRFAGISDSSPLTIFISGLKGGLLTFGGAYTAIPFVQQDAVSNYGWLSNQQFLDGIALSGMIPAPLIIFTSFVGYFAGGWPGAFLITAGIFLPAFSFTLIGHKLMEKVIQNKSLHNFLDGVTAGVIGLISVTAIQLFRTSAVDLFSISLFIICLIILFKTKWKFISPLLILGCGLVSLIFFKLL